MKIQRAIFAIAVVFVSFFALVLHCEAGERAGLNPAESGILDSFESWAKSRKEKTAQGLAANDDADGENLARQRRAVLKDLIKRNPGAALANALSATLRKDLPATVSKHLEERISGKGSFGVLAVQDPVNAGAPIVFRTVEIDGKSYDAYVYGNSLGLKTSRNISLHGIAVDGSIALLDSRLRVLEAGEEPEPKKKKLDRRCPVSGKAAGFDQEPDDNDPDVIAESGDTTYYICSAAHVGAVDQEVAAAELPAPAYNSIGTKNVLVMRVDFPDKPGESVTVAQATTNMEAVRQYFYSASFQQMDMTVTITSLLRMPQNGSYYSGGNLYSELQNTARSEATAAGYTGTYDHDVITFTNIGFGWGGLGWVGGKGSWVQGNGLSTGVTAHELGHNIGNWHANFWNSTGDSIIGAGTHEEYGNSFDVLGSSGSFPNGHFNTNFKNNVNWLPAANLFTANSSGTYQIYAMDHGGVLGTNRYSINIPVGLSVGSISSDYWVEFRQKFTSNKWLKDGVTLKLGKAAIDKASRLLDTTPSSPDGKNDAAIVIGRTYSDVGNGVHVTPIRKMGTTPESIEVVVNRGSFAGNGAPTVSISASQTSVATATAVTFNATASDPNGDTLTYYWDFGDRNFGLSADSRTFTSTTKSWGTAGEYVVRCTVSDMKGQTASDSVIITVGSPTTFRISGIVLDDVGQPMTGVRVHNGKAWNDAAYRFAYTDSDGTYTIVGLAAGSFTVGAVKNGYTVTADATWSNPVAVGPNAAGINFTATPVYYKISGTVTDENGSAVAGVVVSDGTRSEPTNATGNFTINNVPVGSYTLTATKTGYTFVASGWTNPVSVSTADVTGRNFTNNVPRYTVSGTVAGGSTQTLVTDGTRSTYCQRNGSNYNYTLSNVPAGSWTIRATESGKSFSPSNFTNPLLVNANKSSINFALDAAQKYAISGRVTDQGSVLPGVTISITGAASASTTTDAKGEYYVGGLANGSYTITPSKTGFSFSPVNRAATVNNANITGQDFATTVSATSASISATDSAATEAAGNTGQFTITLSATSSSATTVNFTVAGSAGNGGDYASIGASVSIPANATSATVTITPSEDSIFEGNETVVLTLAAGAGYSVGTPNTATVTISDNETAPTASITANDATATEAAGNAGQFTITLSGTSSSATTVNYTVSGSANSGSDYASIGTSVSVPANATSATVTITPSDDSIFEGSETVVLTLSSGTGYSVGTPNTATVTISDNETAPTATITATDNSASETAGNTGVFTISLSGTSSSATSVNYTIAGSATNGSDYNSLATAVSIPAGSSSATVTVSAIDDALAEGDESVSLTLAAGSGYSVGTPGSATVTIADNEPVPTASITATDASATEAAGNTGLFTISLSGTSSAAITLNYTISGSATNGTDYTSTVASVTIPANSTSATVTVTPSEDSIFEGNETVVLTLAAGTGYSVGTPNAATVTISDNETAPTASITANDAAATEAAGNTGQFTVTLSGASSSATTVNFTRSGSATNGTDYTSIATSVSVPANSTSATVTITPSEDTIFEGSETVILTLATGTGYSVGTPNSATVTISDNDTAPTASITASDATATEAAGNTGQFTITLSNPSSSATSVNYTVSGSAINGTDYTTVAAAVSIPANSTTATVTVTPGEDSVFEGDETATLTLASGTGYSVGTPNSATVTISDNETAPTATITANDATATEAPGDTGQFTITLSSTSSSATTVNLARTGSATNGTDYTSIATSVTIPANATSATVTVTPSEDSIFEGSETVILTLAAGTGYSVGTPNAATVTISDNETAPTASITANDATATEAAGNTGQFTVTLSGASSSATSVNFTRTGSATNGTDYTSIATSVSVPANSTSATVTITPSEDSIFEGSETVILTLATGTGYSVGTPNTATVTISDNEAAPTATITANDATATEAAGNTGQFTITLSGTSSSATTVNYTRTGSATNGTDYTSITTSVSIPANATSATVTITPSEDSIFEGSETVILTLATGTGYSVGTPSSATVTISDNETAPTASITASDATATEAAGNTGQFTITLSGVSSSATSVNLTISGSAANGADYTTVAASVSVPANATSATVTITPSEDSIFEGSENVILTLAAGTGYSVSTPNTATVTISDNETAPTASIAATDSTANETAGDTGVLTVSLSGASSSATTVNFTIGGSATSVTDYAALTTSVSIPANTTSATITITPSEDLIVEGDETVTLTLAAGTGYSVGAPASATVTINDNDGLPSASITASDATATEAAGNPGQFTVTLTAVSSSATTVNIALGGTAGNGIDYALIGTTVVIPAGSTAATVSIAPLDDATFEGDETVTLTLAAGIGYTVGVPDTATVTIADDEINTAPVAANGSFIVAKNSSFNGILAASDAQNQALTFSIVTAPAKGTVVITNAATGAFTYTARANVKGSDSFTFKANDGSLDSNIATVSISIKNNVPAAADSSLAATAGSATASTLPAADGDNDSLTYTLVSQPAKGTVALDAATGQFTYTPFADASGNDSFTFEATDGLDSSNLATVTIAISSTLTISSVPTALPNPALPSQTVTFTVAGSGNDPIVWTWDFGDGSPAQTGASVTHAYVAAGVFSASVAGVDALGQTASASVSVTVADGTFGGGVAPPVDTDGDGVNDDTEIADGTDPLNAGSFKRIPMKVSKLSGSLKFGSLGGDSVGVTGTLPELPAGFNPADFTVSVDVGGVTHTFLRGTKGAATSATAAFKFKLKYVRNAATKAKSLASGPVQFKFLLKKGSWLESFLDEGVDETKNQKKAPMSLIVDVKLMGNVYSDTVNTLCSCKAQVGAKFKK